MRRANASDFDTRRTAPVASTAASSILAGSVRYGMKWRIPAGSLEIRSDSVGISRGPDAGRALMLAAPDRPCQAPSRRWPEQRGANRSRTCRVLIVRPPPLKACDCSATSVAQSCGQNSRQDQAHRIGQRQTDAIRSRQPLRFTLTKGLKRTPEGPMAMATPPGFLPCLGHYCLRSPGRLSRDCC